MFKWFEDRGYDKTCLALIALAIALTIAFGAYMIVDYREQKAIEQRREESLNAKMLEAEQEYYKEVGKAAAEEELAAEKAAAEERAALDEKLKNSEPPVFNIDENSPEYERIFAKRWSELNDVGLAPVKDDPEYEEGMAIYMGFTEEEFSAFIEEAREYRREQAESDATNPIINSKSAAEYIAEAQGVWISPEAQEAERKLAEERIKDDELARSLGFENYAALKKSADTDGDGGVSVPEGYAVGLYTKEEYDSWVAAGEFADSIVWGEVGEGTKAFANSDYR